MTFGLLDCPIDWTNGEASGLLPLIISSSDDAPAAEQIAEGYAHGGGFKPQSGFTYTHGPLDCALLSYPGDPDLHELSRIFLPFSNELVVLFEHDFVAIVQEDDGALAVTRMD